MLDVIKQQATTLFEQRVAEIERATTNIPDGRLFVPVAPGTNSVGNLVLHLSGNLRTLVGRVAGGIHYERDRDYEFAATGMPRDALMKSFLTAVDVTRSVLAKVDAAKWCESIAEPGVTPFAKETRGDHVLRALEHFGYHAGQIVLISKILAMMD